MAELGKYRIMSGQTIFLHTSFKNAHRTQISIKFALIRWEKNMMRLFGKVDNCSFPVILQPPQKVSQNSRDPFNADFIHGTDWVNSDRKTYVHEVKTRWFAWLHTFSTNWVAVHGTVAKVVLVTRADFRDRSREHKPYPVHLNRKLPQDYFVSKLPSEYDR